MTTRPSCVALVPAAGAALRMGCSKAALEWQGRSFLGHVLALLESVQPAAIYVVQGAHPLRGLIEQNSISVDVTLLHNPHWRSGPLTSLQLGIRRALADLRPQAVLVATIDRPRVRAQTIAELTQAFTREPDCVWQPRMAGRSGHPIIYPRDFARALLELGPEQSSRTLLRDSEGPWPARRRFVDTLDPGILENFDDPASLAKLNS